MAQRIEADPLLALLDRAPVVPLTEEEAALLDDMDPTEPTISHQEVVRRLRERPDAG